MSIRPRMAKKHWVKLEMGSTFTVWCLVFGIWYLVFGVWCLVFGVYRFRLARPRWFNADKTIAQMLFLVSITHCGAHSSQQSRNGSSLYSSRDEWVYLQTTDSREAELYFATVYLIFCYSALILAQLSRFVNQWISHYERLRWIKDPNVSQLSRAVSHTMQSPSGCISATTESCAAIESPYHCFWSWQTNRVNNQ